MRDDIFMETHMSSKMQQFVEQLAQHHDVALYTAQSQLWMHHSERQEALLISNLDGQRISVSQCDVQNENLGLNLGLIFLIEPEGEWLPLEVCYTETVWNAYVFDAELLEGLTIEDENGELILHRFTEFHAAQWCEQGWIEHGQRIALPMDVNLGGDHGSYG